MMNKVLITVFVPKIDKTYELFIPINKTVGNVINLLSKAIFELSLGVYNAGDDATVFNKITGNKYDNNIIIKDTDIRNGTELILL